MIRASWCLVLHSLRLERAARSNCGEHDRFARHTSRWNTPLHYLTAGHGPAVILLHGFAENSRMLATYYPIPGGEIYRYRPLIPAGDRRLRDSRKWHRHGRFGPAYSCPGSFVRGREGSSRGTRYRADGGLCLCCLHPAETEKVALMDAFLPGVPGWEPIYSAPNIWQFLPFPRRISGSAR